jgi:hypothetical protein
MKNNIYKKEYVITKAEYDKLTEAYNKCQDKKYTEKDIINAVLFGMQKGLNVGKVEETDNDWVNNYIKSINKQD